MEPQPHGQPVDEDLELALRLHRELNAVPRRQRQPARNQAASAALKTLTKKHQQHDSDSSSSESERSHDSEPNKRRAGGPPSGELRAAGCSLLPRKSRFTSTHRSPFCTLATNCSILVSNNSARLLSPLALLAADNDSGSKRRRQQQEGSKRKPARSRSGARKPPHVAAADEARRKAAAAGAAAAADDAQPRTHVKCFFAGLPHGAWLAVEALASRASLAAAVSHAFRDDGVACSSETATVVFVAADKQSHEFVGGQPTAGAAPKREADGEGQPAAAAQHQQGGGAGEDAEKWRAAARSAVRVYVR
jgi:hypothetical protein